MCEIQAIDPSIQFSLGHAGSMDVNTVGCFSFLFFRYCIFIVPLYMTWQRATLDFMFLKVL